MKRERILQGSTVDEIREIAAKEFNCLSSKVTIEIIDESKSGLLGLFGPVRLTAKASYIQKEGVGTLAKIVARTILDAYGENYQVDVREGQDEVILNIKGERTGKVIGKEGQNLAALQHLVSKIVSKRCEEDKKIIIDVEGYRNRRKSSVLTSVKRLAIKVKKTGKPLLLDSMSAYDRYVIHNNLGDDRDVYTKSIGNGNDRRIIMIPMKLKSKEDDIIRSYQKKL